MPSSSAPTPAGLFPPTRWTVLLAARSSPEARRAAVEALATTYWRPLYGFLRRRGLDSAAAQDAVQELLAQLIERNALDRLAPEKGRLRAFLQASAKNLLANRHAAGTAEKRGGSAVHVPIDAAIEEMLALQGPATTAEDADRRFEREWATGVMERALAQLRAEFERSERSGPFPLLEQFFRPGATPPSYRDAAQAHGLSVPQLKSLLHRIRLRFRELVRAEVADTVESAGEVDAELGRLLEALST